MEYLVTFVQTLCLTYSQVPNNWGIWNNWGGGEWKFLQKLIIGAGVRALEGGKK